MILVHLNQIPEEGLQIEGEENADILDIQDPLIAPAGPIRYALDVGVSGRSLFATGTLEVALQFTCVNCLENFTRAIRLDGFALQTDLTGPESIDLTPYVREDILLTLPAHPHCDWDGKNVCSGARLPGLGDKKTDRPPGTWDTLDQLNLKN